MIHGEQSSLFATEVVLGLSREGIGAPTPRARSRRIGTILTPRKTSRVVVLDALRDGPKTDEEIAQVTALDGNTVRPRRLELLHDGLIEDSGTVRPTKRGREAIVWQLANAKEAPRCGSR